MWLAVVLAAAVPMPALSQTFPAEMPATATLLAWERVSGQAVADGGSRIHYELMVDPARMALWAVTRYRIHDVSKAQPEDEILIWSKSSRAPVDMRCYRRVLRLGSEAPVWDWERVVAGSTIYREALVRAREVYALNRRREIALEEAEARQR
jgi:hypothetical protein